MPELSIIVPAYNEAERIPPSLERLRAWMDARGADDELLVVDDGSTDATAERVLEVAERDPRVFLVRNGTNRGKGYSVAHGVARARGRRVLFTDADLSTPIQELSRLERALEDEGADIAIASRGLPESRLTLRQPWYREGMGRVFNLLVRALAVPGIYDTQCGFKLFEADAARRLFDLRRVDGFAFDVEILHLAHRLNLRVVEVPVTWAHDEATRVRLLEDAARMFVDIARIRWFHRGTR